MCMCKMLLRIQYYVYEKTLWKWTNQKSIRWQECYAIYNQSKARKSFDYTKWCRYVIGIYFKMKYFVTS